MKTLACINTQQSPWQSNYWLWSLLLMGCLACDANKKEPIKPAQIITGTVLSVTHNTAKCEGSIDPGSETVSEVGHCWSLTNNQPSTNDTKSSVVPGKTKQVFTSSLMALESEKTYYVRAYALIAGKTYYGDLVTFTTAKPPIPPPTITTNPATDIQYNTAKLSFTIQFAQGGSASQHGVCWGTNNNPSINDNKTTLGNASGTVNASSVLTGLTEKLTYYARAYATVDTETYYGNVVSFTTSDVIPTINTSEATDITTNAAKVAFAIQLAAGTSASQHGVCWATNNNPTINDSRTSLGATNTNVNSNSTLTSLAAKTTYYARAYATVNGTNYYGNVVSFATLTDTPQTSDGTAGYLFYNAVSGQAVFGEILNNNYRDIKALGSLGTGWRHVVAYKEMVFMMDLGLRTGVAALFDGKQIVKNFSGIQFFNWTHVSVVNDQWLLFYNANSGAYAFGDIQNNEYRVLFSGTNFSPNWTSILSFGSDLFFYNADAGTGVWGSFNGSTFTQYSGTERLESFLTLVSYGNRGCFGWYRNSGEVGYIYNYSPSGVGIPKPSLTQIQKINLKLYKSGIVTAGNTKNLAQMLDTSLDIYSVDSGNKLMYQRTVGINTWTHLITVKFN